MRNSRGFTLIELLVVIAIIGILSSVVLASLNSARQKSRDARRISDLKQLQLALELYYDANNQTYPITADFTTELAPNYISVIPQDPLVVAYDYAGLEVDNSSCDAVGECESYVVGATMEGSIPSGSWGSDIGSVACAATDRYCVRP